MPLIALAVLFGALFAFYGNSLPEPLWFAYWPVLLLLAWCQTRYRFLLVMSAAYLFTGSVFYSSLQRQLPVELHDQTLTLRGEIVSLITRRPGRQTFLFSPNAIDKQQHSLPPLIRLNWYQDAVIPEPGSIWQLEVKLRPPRGRLNPGGFDYEKWLLVQGIGATGYVRNSSGNQILSAANPWGLIRIRHELLAKLRAACRDCPTAGLINGLAIGFRGDITPRHRELLQATGTAHLLAISGLHIGLVSLLFFWIGRVLWKTNSGWLPISCIAMSSGMALLGATVYAAMAGFSLPTQRALIFVVVIFIASLLRHKLNLLQCIAIATVIILVLDPLAIGSASFWLTLSALLVINLSLFQLRHVNSRWQQVLGLQFNFFLLLSLPSLMLIGHFSLVSLPANLLAIPLVSFLVLPLVFLAAVLLMFEMTQLSSWLLGFSNFCLDNLLRYLEVLERQGPPLQDGGLLPQGFSTGCRATACLVVTVSQPGPETHPAGSFADDPVATPRTATGRFQVIGSGQWPG